MAQEDRDKVFSAFSGTSPITINPDGSKNSTFTGARDVRGARLVQGNTGVSVSLREFASQHQFRPEHETAD